MSFFYELIEKGTNFITFIHGLGEDYSIFNKQTAHAHSLNYSTLTYDLRGHGRSDFGKEISIPSHARDLENILELEDISKTNLVGFSLGASVALEYAYQHPERVNKLCLINPGLYDKKFFTKKLKLVNLLMKPFELLSKTDKTLRKNLVDLSKTPATPVYFALPYSLRNTSLTGMYANLKAMKDYGVPNYLSKIKSPTLILISKKDELIKPALAQYLHQQLPNSEVSVIKGNHLLLLKNPQEVNKKLEEFFS